MKIHIKSGQNEVTVDLSACQPKEINPNNLISLSKAASEGNPQNPFDEIGTIHNQVIRALSAKNSPPKGDEETVKQLTEIGESFALSPAAKKRYGKFDAKDFIKAFRTNVIDGCIPEFPPLRYPDYFDDFMKNFFLGTIYEARNFDATTSDVHAIHQRIVQAGETVEGKEKSKSDKDKVLPAISIVRHSLEYWHTQSLADYGDKNGPKGNTAAEDPFRFMRHFGVGLEAYSENADQGEIIAAVYAGWVSYRTSLI